MAEIDQRGAWAGCMLSGTSVGSGNFSWLATVRSGSPVAVKESQAVVLLRRVGRAGVSEAVGTLDLLLQASARRLCNTLSREALPPIQHQLTVQQRESLRRADRGFAPARSSRACPACRTLRAWDSAVLRRTKM